jgi:hypothetical protein
MRGPAGGSFANNRDSILEPWRGLRVLLVNCASVIGTGVQLFFVIPRF